MAGVKCALGGALRELEGLGYADIVQITGASEDAVRGRIHRARVQLAEVMRPWR